MVTSFFTSLWSFMKARILRFAGHEETGCDNGSGLRVVATRPIYLNKTNFDPFFQFNPEDIVAYNTTDKYCRYQLALPPGNYSIFVGYPSTMIGYCMDVIDVGNETYLACAEEITGVKEMDIVIRYVAW